MPLQRPGQGAWLSILSKDVLSEVVGYGGFDDFRVVALDADLTYEQDPCVVGDRTGYLYETLLYCPVTKIVQLAAAFAPFRWNFTTREWVPDEQDWTLDLSTGEWVPPGDMPPGDYRPRMVEGRYVRVVPTLGSAASTTPAGTAAVVVSQTAGRTLLLNVAKRGYKEAILTVLLAIGHCARTAPSRAASKLLPWKRFAASVIRQMASQPVKHLSKKAAVDAFEKVLHKQALEQNFLTVIRTSIVRSTTFAVEGSVRQEGTKLVYRTVVRNLAYDVIYDRGAASVRRVIGSVLKRFFWEALSFGFFAMLTVDEENAILNLGCVSLRTPITREAPSLEHLARAEGWLRYFRSSGKQPDPTDILLLAAVAYAPDTLEYGDFALSTEDEQQLRAAWPAVYDTLQSSAYAAELSELPAVLDLPVLPMPGGENLEIQHNLYQPAAPGSDNLVEDWLFNND